MLLSFSPSEAWPLNFHLEAVAAAALSFFQWQLASWTDVFIRMESGTVGAAGNESNLSNGGRLGRGAGGGGGREEGDSPKEYFVMLKETAEILMLPKGMLKDATVRKEVRGGCVVPPFSGSLVCAMRNREDRLGGGGR